MKERISKTDLYSVALKGLWFCIGLNGYVHCLKDGDIGLSIGYAIGIAIISSVTYLEVNLLHKKANKEDSEQ